MSIYEKYLSSVNELQTTFHGYDDLKARIQAKLWILFQTYEQLCARFISTQVICLPVNVLFMYLQVFKLNRNSIYLVKIIVFGLCLLISKNSYIAKVRFKKCF